MKSTIFLSLESINWIKFALTLFALRAFRNNLAKILFVLIASDPPFKITAFPDLKHKLATSEVTLGLLSYITPITPIGIETLLIFNPFGLLHFSKILSIGSFSLIIFFIELFILSNFF